MPHGGATSYRQKGPLGNERHLGAPEHVIERLRKPLHASLRSALRQAWELDDPNEAERLLRNLARRLEPEAPGVAASILEGSTRC